VLDDPGPVLPVLADNAQTLQPQDVERM